MLKKNRFRNSSFIALTLACSVLLSACATDPRKTGSIGRNSKPIEQMTVQELKQTTAKYGQLYERDPTNKQVGLFYANILRTTGRNEQALAVMQQMVIHHPEDNDVLSAYGKALAASGNLAKALKIIDRAHPRQKYRKALDIVPNEASVLSNLGMSYVLSGDLRTAETYLQEAIKNPSADSRVRQNLALVVGLQGDFEKAETIARGELPQAEAEENIKFLRGMLSQQSAWNLIKNSDQ